MTKLFLRPAVGDRLEIEVDLDSTTLLSLKRDVASRLSGFDSHDSVRIVAAGRILRDDEATLKSLGLEEGMTLHVVKLVSDLIT